MRRLADQVPILGRTLREPATSGERRVRTTDDRSGRGAAALALLLAAAAAVSSCAPLLPTRLYTLVPAEVGSARAGEADPSGPTLGLDPVTLPAYLDRPEIVTRAGSHQVRLGEFDKWVEPLQPMFRRLLEERLREATGAREVVAVPPPGGTAEPRHAVAVEVERFDADEAGKVRLAARWRVYRPATGRTVRAGRAMIEERGAAPPDYPGLVAAMGRAVDALADAIAAAVPGAGGR